MLLIILLIQRFAPPVASRISVLLGIVAGTLIAIPFGFTDFSGLGDAALIGISTPFHFGLATFEIAAIVPMIVVMLVTMTETTGDILAVGQMVDRQPDARRLADGLRADGLSTVLGGIFNTFPYAAFAQNVGLVGLTGVRSRHVVAFGGGILVLLGLIPVAVPTIYELFPLWFRTVMESVSAPAASPRSC